MSKFILIVSSPRGCESKSTLLADTYAEAARAANPLITIDRLDLWKEKLPPFDGDKAAAKMNVSIGAEHNAVEKTAWDDIVAIADRFRSADHYLIATPMWNGGIPYTLKHYIDLIHQPGLLFDLDPKIGYIGLLKNKRATLFLTAAAFGPQMPSPAFGVDYQSTYLKNWLFQAGVVNVDEVRLQPSMMTDDPEVSLARATEEAARLAKAHVEL